jgi:hypothetical protein
MLDESASTGATASPEERRAAFQAGWDDRLLPLLTTEWQSSMAIAALVGASKDTVLARLKDMCVRELAERRIVKIARKLPPNPNRKKPKRPRVHTARFEAQFRRRA